MPCAGVMALAVDRSYRFLPDRPLKRLSELFIFYLLSNSRPPGMTVSEPWRDFSPVGNVSMTLQLTEHVRGLVHAGTLRPGTRLPPTTALATGWGTTVATVQSALTPLVKEGLLERRPRVGTRVLAPTRKLQRIGIYQPHALSTAPSAAFRRAVTDMLCKLLTESGRQWTLWTDPRPEVLQSDPWSDLLQAAGNRAFQALIAPTTDDQHLGWQLKLPVPAAFLCSARIPNRVSLDGRQFGTAAVRCLASQGCRSVGLIGVSPRTARYADGSPHEFGDVSRGIETTAEELGIRLRDEWMLTPPTEGVVSEQNSEQFGYDSVHALWRQAPRPDGLIVYTDVAARGAIMALLELSVRVPDELRLVLHRNRQVGLLCPFPASFVDVDVERIARELLGLVERQHAGEPVNEVILPHTITIDTESPQCSV